MISLRKANLYYNFLLIKHIKRSYIYKNLLSKKPYFVTCNIFDRHPRPSSIYALDTMFNIGLKGKELDNALFESLDKSQKHSYILGNNLNFKIFFKPKFLISLLKSVIKFFIKLVFALLDTIYMVSYSFIYINFKRKRDKFSIESIDKNKKINLFTFHYWKSKKDYSIYHYYPGAKYRKNEYFYASEFPEFYSIGDGLRNSKKNILKCLDFVSNKDLLISIFYLIESYWFDFFGQNKKTYGTHINNLIKLNYLNRRLLHLLNFHSAKYIINNFKFNSIYVWSENQNDSKLFSVGLIKFKPRESKTNIISYIGCSSFASQYHQQFIPTKYELDLGVWGENIFMLPDQTSLDELKSVLSEKYTNKKFEYIKIEKEMKRFNFKNIKKISNFSNKRDFTFITHGTENEFIQVLRLLFTIDTKIEKRIRIKKLYIRLHPSLSIKKMQKFIFLLKKDSRYKMCKINFINNKNESFAETLYKTKFSIFGDSSLINIALSLEMNVISLRTSYTYKAPIQRIYLKKKNLLFL